MVMDMGGSMLTQYRLPEPQQEHFERIGIDYKRETSYDIEKERHISNQNRNLLNEEQRIVHDSFVASALSATSSIFFLDAPGECGKTFLIQTILATIRSQNKIVIATASSGLAATLLSAGRTIHSTYKVPLNLTNVDQPICSIKKGTSLERLIKECCAIVIDEAPMTNKLVFKALHRSLCDITGKNEPMGGIATLLCGEFRQILPVVVVGTRANIVNSCIKSSMLWSCITPLQLRTNMRVYLSGSTEAGIFADMLLRLGDGLIPATENPDTIPLHQFGIIVQTTKQLIDSVFPDFVNNISNAQWLTERAILTPLNDTALKINFEMMQNIPGNSMVYLSIDTTVTGEKSVHYPTEFLNSIEVAGLSSHKLCQSW
ncbi:ATP-dependent dna helicase pif7-like protein [Elysia marginata]|uniref:ATP-dependent DNA helicase n=1 Tax=Elysia marginata TaxID=1093978 RepID=A0AAV4FMN9_9GAST|nr:ATP-dependent dna helicase pif7-like protein [Elysia marginata]